MNGDGEIAANRQRSAGDVEGSGAVGADIDAVGSHAAEAVDIGGSSAAGHGGDVYGACRADGGVALLMFIVATVLLSAAKLAVPKESVPLVSVNLPAPVPPVPTFRSLEVATPTLLTLIAAVVPLATVIGSTLKTVPAAPLKAEVPAWALTAPNVLAATMGELNVNVPLPSL